MISRLEKVYALMSSGEHGPKMDVMLVSAPDAIFYLTGVWVHPGERLLTLVLQPDKQPMLYVPAMFQVGVVDFDVTYYQDHEQPLVQLASALPNASVVGVDKDWPARFLLAFMAMKPSTQVINGSFVIDRARVSKDEHEIQLMAAASQLNDQVMAEVVERLKGDSLTEIQMSDFIHERFMAHGAQGNSFDTIACFGVGSSQPHHECDHTILSPGPIIIDMGCVLHGYCSDMTRSFYYGQPTEAYIKAYNAVKDANLAAIEMVRPGVPLSVVDGAARQLLVNRGLGEYFVHRTGHGIGISVHEYPDVSSVSEAICQVGMIFSIEPGVYLGGEFGIRIEDLVVVTEDGCTILNEYPKELQVLSATIV